MSRIRSAFLSIITISVLFSCNNEIDINADWKETIIVYGLLDPLDSVQYFRIEKAYLDEKTSALVIAGIADSLYLDTADVILRQTDDASVKITLNKTYPGPRDSGLFADNPNILWTTKAKILENKEYEIEVRNPKTGGRVWARTRVIIPAQISAPVKNSNSNFTIFPEYLTVDFFPRANSAAYDVTMDFIYEDILNKDTTKKVQHSIRWNLLKSFSVNPNQNAVSKIPRLSFLQFLSAAIPVDTTVRRRVKFVNFTFYGANQTLVDYISVNQPSIGIVQKTAEYTNINGGYGVFASRCVQRINGVKMDPASVNIIRTNVETKNLNFIQ